MGFDDSTTSSVTMNTLSPSDDDPVNLLDNVSLALSGFSSSLSIIGASIIFLTYNVEVRNARIRQTRRLLMFLTVADIMTACGILTGTIRYAVIHQQHDVITIKEHEYLCTHPDEICIAQSMITTFSGMASFCWTLVIGIHLIVSLRPSSAVSDPERPWSEIKAHVICWGLPGVITMTALGYDMLGENFSIGTGPWCWIKVCLKERKVSTMYIWMAVTGKGWDIVTYVVSMVFFLLLVFYLRRRGFSISDLPRRTEHRLRQADANFVFLWLLTYVLKVWGTVRFFMNMTEYKTYRKDVPTFDSMEKFLLYMQSFCDGLQAFCNCILFVFLDRTMINGMINHFRCTLARRQPLLQDSQSRYGSTNC